MTINFEGSTQSTVGAELELQVIDPESGDLAPGGPRILNACKEQGIEGVSGEFLVCMLEVKSDVCQNVATLRDNFFPRLRQVRNIARSLGFELAMGGTHPFAKPSMSAISPDERYQKMVKRQGWSAYHEIVFGLHVHVGVPDGDLAIGAVNRCVEYLPHLLALSANSPFWQGIDTDYSSARMRMFRPSASTGIPMHFINWQGFCDYCQAMQDAKLIESVKDIYWDIRPQAKFGTIEFRIFDVPSTLASLLGLVALSRCLVVDNLRFLQEHREAIAGEPAAFWLARENRWLASRYGLETMCSRRPEGPRLSVADDAVQLLERLAPLAGELGESEFLNAIWPGRGLEIGADRQRRIYRQTGDWHTVMDDMRKRWMQELDESAAGISATSSAPPAA